MRLKSVRGTGGGIVLLLALVALVPVLIASTVVQHRRALHDEDRRLSYEADEQMQTLAETFERTRSLTQILAFNPAFQHVYQEPGSLREKVRNKIPAVREANEALAHVQTLFPGQIGEACFIDARGFETARAVMGQIAPLSELSNDETRAIFFRPAFALTPGSVHQSRPYVSPDTQEWVIASAAPIPRIGGAKRAIVHFELTLESIRRAMSSSEGYAIQIVDRTTSRILVDTRYRQRPRAQLAPQGTPHTHPAGSSAPSGPHVHLQPGVPAGLLTEANHRAAFRTVPVDANNGNRWTVVARATEPRPTWASSQSGWQLAILAVVLALLPLALLYWLRGQRNLSTAAMTDPLTGLGNRRSMAAAFDRQLAGADPERPLLLALYDLDGFKLYNDTFGHPAGDALLKRLSENLAASLPRGSAAFRMGGDEFCVITPLDRPQNALPVVDKGAKALRERGTGFAVKASFGAILLPEEAKTPEEALRLADQRMYTQKNFSRASASRQTTDVLLSVLAERDEELGEHGSSVAKLAERIALSMGAAGEEIEEIRRAGALHDIGKLAIPESILGKPGPLTDDEWAFVRRHTLVGARIIGAAPALAGVARIVRASHEAWDGSGYPDSVSGTDVPLGARIVAVCDAFEAMTSERPYRPARSPQEALAEIRRCAGTQFDPDVVAAFCVIAASRDRVLDAA